MILMNGLDGLNGEADRAAAASYCGQKFGVSSIDFQPCVNHYVAGMAGDYKLQATGSSGSGGGGASFDWGGLLTNVTTGVVKGLFNDDPAGGGLPPGYVPPLPPPPAPAWYATPTGMIGIGVGALALIFLLRK